MNTIELLTIKSLKVLVRKGSNRTLISVSSIVVFCTLYLMWYLSRHQKLRFMSSDAYQKLQFNMKCTSAAQRSGGNSEKQLECVPDGDAVDRSSKGLTPSDLLFNKLSTGMLLTDNDETSQFAGLLSSLMMNGLPLLGLDDFVHFSDFVNAHLGSKITTKILASPGYKEKFGNFLEVRSNRILLYPDNCWTQQFVSYLQASSKVFKALKYKVYGSRKQAMRHCCRNVWAVLEIEPTFANPVPSSPFSTFATAPVFSTTGTDVVSLSSSPEWKCAAFDPQRWNETSYLYTLFDAFPTQQANTSSPISNFANTIYGLDQQSMVIPAVTIRMHPAAVPDTRNFEHSPINRHLNSRQQSGQLLYFTSGFLTLQLEVQNFLAHWHLGGSVIQSDAFSGRNEGVLLEPAYAAHSLAQAIARATTRKEVYEVVLNATQTQTQTQTQSKEGDGQKGVRPSLSFPLFHRAFPTHNYKQSMFWHTFGALTSIGLIVYFSLPAAVTAGELSRERATGLIDVLSTLPNVRGVHSTFAWCLCGACWVTLSTILSLVFFYAVLLHTPALLPALTLGLLGVVLCPMAAIIGTFVKNADTLVVAVPTVVFVTLLPGLLYFELAFDIQRSLFNELALCLLPASAAALLLRTVCGYEAINAGVTWSTRAAISNTPMYVYVLMLWFDVLLYSGVCYAVAAQAERRPLKHASAETEMEAEDVPSGCCSSPSGACPSCFCCISSLYHYVTSFHSSTVMPPTSSHAHLTAAQIEQAESLPRIPSHSLPPRHTARSMEHTSKAKLNISSIPAVTNMTKNAALKVRSVTKQYASGESNVVVLSDINANLCENSVTLLLGSNGAGKTTLMKVLCGLDTDFTGQVLLQPSVTGNAATNPTTLTHSIYRSTNTGDNNGPIPATRAIGWCPQNDALFEHLTVEEHIILFTYIIHRQNNQSGLTSLFSSSHNPRGGLNNSNKGLEAFVLSTLQKLDLVPHRHKAVCELSGGMKRRLSLSLAFLGKPRVLFLDEPTSGCDAWTRELVRKHILSRRGDCAILISTHHTDDIEILADRVWFLSERYLEVDEEVQHLAAWRSRELAKLQRAAANSGLNTHNNHVSGVKEPTSASSGGLSANSSHSSFLSTEEENSGNSDSRQYNDNTATVTASGGHAMEFSTCDERVKQAFTDLFGAKKAHTWINAASTGSTDKDGSVYVTWIVPVDYLHLLRQLVATLESNGLTSWSLSTCSMYSTLCHLYDKDKHNNTDNTEASTTTASIHSSVQQSRFAHLWAILWLRWLELYKRKASFFLAQVLLPFVIVLCIALGCRDVKYPKTEISSAKVGGLGEMFFAEGETPRGNGGADLSGRYSSSDRLDEHSRQKNELTRLDEKTNTKNITNQRASLLRAEASTDSAGALDTLNLAENLENTDPISNTISNVNVTNPQHAALVEQYGTSNVAWSTARDSDALWMSLFDDYYAHESDRWAAFVMHDRIAQWLESTVTVAQSGLTVDIGSVFEEVQRAQLAVCNGYHKYINGSSSNRKDLLLHLNNSDPSSFCGRLPAISVQIRNSTSFVSTPNADPSVQYTNASIAITSYQSLHSNLTMLSNVTSDHAAPSYLKEVVPVVYSLLQSRLNGSQKLIPNATVPLQANYLLYSHPLPLSNRSNEVYLARGYLGSTIVVLYMLMTTIVCVRTVIKLRRTGVQTQLHLASLHPLTFWTANFLFDSALIAVTLFAALGAIIVGGAPISNYFFEFPPLPGYLLGVCIVTFAMAVTASSYALVVQSVDQLSSQMLLLVSTVAGGMFLKLYLDRHKGEYQYQLLNMVLLWVSPAFTFSTAVFHMIATHARQVSASAQGKAGPNLDTLESSVYHCCGVMLLQAMVYLALCVCVDMYWYKLRAIVGRWRWYYSATNTNQNEPKVQQQQLSSYSATGGTVEGRSLLLRLSIQTPTTTKYGSGYGTTNASSIATATITSDTVPGEIGIFPHVHTAEYRSLIAPSLLDIESSGDLETPNNESVPLLPRLRGQEQARAANLDALVCAENVVVTYAGHTQLPLDHTTFRIAPTERVALMGMNGGGKSTLFRSLALAENIPVSGTLSIAGLDSVQDVWQLSAECAVGYVPQEGGLLEFLTVEQSLTLFALLRPARATPHSSRHHIRAQDDIIPSKYYSYPISALSGGTRKKLAVQLANTHQPRLLLLDECTTGVDPIAAERIVRYLKHTQPSGTVHRTTIASSSSPPQQHQPHQNQQQGMLFASHRIDESLAVCSRVLMLVRGKVFLDGPISMFHDLAYRYYQVDITLPSLVPSGSSEKKENDDNDFGFGFSYQHDLPSVETPTPTAEEARVRMDNFLFMLTQTLLTGAPHSAANYKQHVPSSKPASSPPGAEPLERCVVYSDTLIRITFQKHVVSISAMWEQLAHWQQAGVILTYAFRNMEMEEVLSSIIDAEHA